MPPQDNTTNNNIITKEKPTVGSFSAPKKMAIQDSLTQILEKRLRQTIPEGASLEEIDKITSEKNNAQTLLSEMKNRQVQTALNKPNYPGNIGGEIKVPGVPSSFTERDREEKFQELKKIIDINQQKKEWSDIKSKKIEIITPEIINSIPSEKSLVRSKKLMPKISAPRPRLVNGRTLEERKDTLLKKETTPEETIVEIGREVISNVVEGAKRIDATVERMQAYDYQKIGDLVEKLVGTDSKKFILTIFSEMFSNPTTNKILEQ